MYVCIYSERGNLYLYILCRINYFQHSHHSLHIYTGVLAKKWWWIDKEQIHWFHKNEQNIRSLNSINLHKCVLLEKQWWIDEEQHLYCFTKITTYKFEFKKLHLNG